MSDLSEERKRQIREEELARARRVKEEEEAFREQVRRELAGETPLATPPNIPEPPPQATRQRQMRVRSPKRGAVVGATCLVAGLALAYYGYASGFEIPGFQGPYRSEIVFDGMPDGAAGEDPDWSVIGEGVEDLVKVATEERPSVEGKPTTTEPAKSSESASTKVPRDSSPPSGSSGEFAPAFRAHVPSGWSVVTSKEGYTEIRPIDDPAAAYVIFYHGMGFSGDIDEAHAANLAWALEDLPRGTRTEDETNEETLQVPGASVRWTAIAHSLEGFEFVRLIGTVVRDGRMLNVVAGVAEENGDRYGDAISEAIRGVEF